MDKSHGSVAEWKRIPADFSCSGSLTRENDGNERKIAAVRLEKWYRPLSANFAVGLLKLEETRACSERHTRALLQKGNLSKSETYEKSSRIAKIAFHGFSMWLVKGKSKWYVELKSDRKYCIGFSATTTTIISLFQAKWKKENIDISPHVFFWMNIFYRPI